MSTLLLRLAAPMQSWGVEAKFDRRTTQRVPTKSGVTGLIAAALGRQRNEGIEDIAKLRFGVRTDRGGVLLRDFHTAKSEKSAYVTNRYYLMDAVFLAGLEGNGELLNKINDALLRPQYPLYLGRRSCPPEGRVTLGVRYNVGLEDALSNEPLLIETVSLQSQKLRITVETSDMTALSYLTRDVPISFDQEHRKFAFRSVHEFTVEHREAAAPEKPTTHDPMMELEE